MRPTLSAMLLLLAATTTVEAQVQDTAHARHDVRRRIEQNFAARAKEELGLTEVQTTQLQEAAQRNAERRRTLEQEHRRLHRALAMELRPGVAADDRTVRRSLDSLLRIRVAVAELQQDEQRELARFLTDVQRAQFYLLRERLAARMEHIRDERQQVPRPPRRR